MSVVKLGYEITLDIGDSMFPVVMDVTDGDGETLRVSRIVLDSEIFTVHEAEFKSGEWFLETDDIISVVVLINAELSLKVAINFGEPDS